MAGHPLWEGVSIARRRTGARSATAPRIAPLAFVATSIEMFPWAVARIRAPAAGTLRRVHWSFMTDAKLYKAEYVGSGTFIISKPKRKKTKQRQSNLKNVKRGSRK